METIKYLCEFFFTNFWHWLGLVILVSCLIPSISIKRIVRRKGDSDDYDKDDNGDGV